MIGEKEKILIGVVKKPRGNSGEVSVIPLTFNPERFTKLTTVQLEYKNGEIRQLKVKSVRFHKKIVIVKFKNVNTPADAWMLEGANITINKSETIDLPEGYYFEHDIYECDVYDENGKLLGKVNSILKTGTNDIFIINSGKDEILLPAIEIFIKNINIKEKTIIVTLPEYV